MRLARELPPLEYLKECFDLKEGGVLLWRVRPREHFNSDRGWKIYNTRFAGTEAGSFDNISGYRRLTLRAYGNYRNHRIVYSIFHESDIDITLLIDHINGNRFDNTPTNLRLVTQAENPKNSSMNKLNTSGKNGVYFNKRAGKWQAFITVENRILHLGLFDAIEEAAAARKAANIKYGFSERHGEPL